MSIPLITINLVVLNGEKYIRHFLDSLEKQTYPHLQIQFNVLDNGSTDGTKEIIRRSLATLGIPKFNLVESKLNLGMWPGQEELLKHTDGEYVVASAVDIILDKDFIKNSVEVMEKDAKLGAIQPKIYKFDLVDPKTLNTKYDILYTKIIDTAGFKIFRSRRVVNVGHGEEDTGPLDDARGRQNPQPAQPTEPQKPKPPAEPQKPFDTTQGKHAAPEVPKEVLEKLFERGEKPSE